MPMVPELVHGSMNSCLYSNYLQYHQLTLVTIHCLYQAVEEPAEDLEGNFVEMSPQMAEFDAEVVAVDVAVDVAAVFGHNKSFALKMSLMTTSSALLN